MTRKWPMALASLSLIALGFSALHIRSAHVVLRHQSLHAAERSGRTLFYDPHLGTNGLTCNTCHWDGGRFSHRRGAIRIPSLVGVSRAFPHLSSNGQRVTTLESQINLCILHRLHGKPLPAKSQNLALLDLYIRHLTRTAEK